MWSEIGLEKELSAHWNIGMGTEYRAQEHDRWAIEANVGYKPCKYLKLGATYNFLYSHKPEERKEHYKDDIMELTRTYLECKRDLDAKTDEWCTLTD